MRWAGGDAAAQEALHELADQIPTGGRQTAGLIFHLSKVTKKLGKNKRKHVFIYINIYALPMSNFTKGKYYMMKC